MSWAPDYCTVDELKSYIRVPDLDDLDDVQLGLAITAASRAIDDATRRQFGLTDSQVRFYSPEWDVPTQRYVVRTDDFPSMGEGFMVEIDSDNDESYATVLTSGIRATPTNAFAEGRPFERITLGGRPAIPAGSLVRVTSAWGWADVPDTIKQATLLQASRVLKRREAVFGVVGSADMGIGETRLLATLDADVAVMVRAYRLAVFA